jgi:1,4-dihydroxy-6-naphthoate synthase
MRFEKILPAVAAGEVDAGVIIHEGRFVYEGFGLELVADLGAVWEADTGLPLPLGVIAAERSLAIAGVFEDRLRASLERRGATRRRRRRTCGRTRRRSTRRCVGGTSRCT